jgi:hypothetical protein
MRNAKVWLFGAFLIAALTGAALLLHPASSAAAPEVLKEHWRNHDGHWCYWHEGDKRWYYTDGTHWFYEEGKKWHLYAFDKAFGKEFVKGEYKVPAPEVKIVVPSHAVFHPH